MPLIIGFAREPGRGDLWVVGKQGDAVLVDHFIEDNRLDVADRQWELVVGHCPERSQVSRSRAEIGEADGRFTA